MTLDAHLNCVDIKVASYSTITVCSVSHSSLHSSFFLTLTFQFHHLTHQVLFPEMSFSLFRKSRYQSFVSPDRCIHKVTYDLKSQNLLLFGEDICFSEGEEFFFTLGGAIVALQQTFYCFRLPLNPILGEMQGLGCVFKDYP